MRARWLTLVLAVLAVFFVFASAGCGRSDLDPLDDLTALPDAGLDGLVPSGDAAGDVVVIGLGDGGDAGVDGALADGGGDGSADGSIDATADGPVKIVTLNVSPPAATLSVATTTALVATAQYSDGSILDVTALATWQSSSTAVATVSLGSVSAVSPGTTTITATYGGVAGTSAITVTPSPLVMLVVTPTPVTIGIGGTTTFAATAQRQDGTVQDVTAGATWTSTAPAVATVAGGIAKGLTAGTARIRASIGGVGGEAQLTVSPATAVSIDLTPTAPTVGVGVTIPFKATATFSDGSVADVTSTATWASSAPGTVGIQATGVATSLSAGTSVITASVGALSGTTLVTVTGATLSSITVSPASATLAIGGRVDLAATATYSDGSTVDVTASASWTSATPATATVASGGATPGRVTAFAAGATTITATLGTRSGTAAITVTPATLASLSITPANPQAPKGTTVPFTATGRYTDGSTLDVTPAVTWAADDATVATVSNAVGTQGRAFGVGVGTTLVRATLGSVTASTTLTVTGVTLGSITITPASPSLVLGTRIALHATAVYSDGTSGDVTSQVVWTSATPSVATVSNAGGAQGQATAVNVGTTVVTARLGAVSGQTTLTVTSSVLQQIVVTPIAVTRVVGDRTQYQAVAVFSNGTQQNVTLQAQWASVSTGVATISGTGLARAVGTGSTTISARYQGVTGSTPLTVTSAVVVEIQVTPLNPTLAVGTVQPFAAVAIYSDSTSRAITGQATWASSAPAVAGVTTNGARGRVTAVSAGVADIRATFQGLTGSSRVTVANVVVVSISVSPSSVTLAPGATAQFTAQAIYSDATSRDVTTQATWRSTNTTAFGVSTTNGSRGLAKALAVGEGDVQATYAGVTGQGHVVVTDRVLREIQVTPFAPRIPAGFATRMQATGIYSDNTTQDLTALCTWTSSTPAVADVSNANATRGLLTPVTAGTTTVRATYLGVTGEDVVTVTSGTLTAITVTPVGAVLDVQASQALVATGAFSDGSTLDVTTYVTWLSSAPAVVSVSNAAGTQGVAKALASGTATVRAVRGSIEGSVVVTVR